MAMKVIQALSLMFRLYLATKSNLIGEGAGMPRPDQQPGFYKIFNSNGYLTAETAGGRISQTRNSSSEGSVWLVQCGEDGGKCDIAALDPPPTWSFYGRLEPTGGVIETFPGQGLLGLNLNVDDPSPSQWNIRPAVPCGGWHITWNLTSGETGYLNGETITIIRPVAEGEKPDLDQIPDENTQWSFEEVNLGSP